jgi:NMD protein affecting ribosome stability and mRNA decay
MNCPRCGVYISRGLFGFCYVCIRTVLEEWRIRKEEVNYLKGDNQT